MYTQRAVKKYRHHSLDDNISISNDDLGYPRLTQFSTWAQVEYVYTPAGQKVREIHRLPKSIVVGGTLPAPHEMDSDTTDYIGPAVYRNGQPDIVRYAGGYASLSKSGSKYVPAFHHYITDYLGNNRAVVRASDGALVQVTHYYPWGSVYGDMGTGGSVQPYKYGDKELDLTAGVARYDYAARAYFAAIPRFDRPDALAAKYPHISPYAFCANNPVNIIDPTGEKPLDYEASLMAAAVYKDKNYGNLIKKLEENHWTISGDYPSIKRNHSAGTGIGMQSMLFKRTTEGVTEYAYVYAGTDCLEDFVEDLTQLVGVTQQYPAAIRNAITLSAELEGSELTFIGHSMGGAQAAAASIATGRDAITFNAAALSFMTKILNGLYNCKPGRIENIVSATPEMWIGQRIIDPVTVAQSFLNMFAEGVQILIPVGYVPSHGIMDIVNALEPN